ncbi:phage tail protein [Lysobacter sp. 5GHs7-4]|uniref:phage tail protein n=1 Tax=Lysobacter sp. 5GHs7-4 TaxID=2904253 RepID=UPI001E4D6A5D|nr:phage tail protein [Lysobacter sp. 5GHs7-4]UHQ21879.1 phage tail protein [Lysobacter sp. 5GHs7-4]
MSGSTIGGVVGAVVGSFIPGVGTQIGWMVGSAIGGYVDPDVIKGPRLTDATVQTSTVGGIITDGDGAFPTTGNLIWWTDLKETKKKERSGKGGPVQVTYHYSRSYAIGICLGPIAGIKTIKRNGKVVYESGTNTENEYVDGNGSPISEAVATAIRANNAKFLDKCTIYLGTDDQMPDPTIEAVEGVGNVSPFRGLAYVVIHDDDLTDLGGAVPQYEFVVVTEGAAVEHDCERNVFFAAPAPDGELYTTQDPNNWSNANKIDTGLDSVDMAYAKEGLIFAFGTLDGVGSGRVSNNSGFSWNDVGNMPNDTVNSMLWVSDANRYLLSTQVSGLFAVTSGGALTSLPAEMPRSYYGLAAIGLTVIAARTGGVERSIDGGSTWSAVSLPAGVDVHYVCASGSAFVAFYATGGISSSPTGAPGTWTDRTNPAGFETASGLAFGNNTFVAVVGAGTVIRSGDNGATWVISADAVSDGGFGMTQNLYYDAVSEVFVWLGSTAAAFTSYDADIWTETATTGVGGIEYVTSLSDGLPPGVEIPDAPGFYVMPDGTIRTNCTGGTIARDRIVLGTVVAKLCRSVGLQDEDFDVSELTDLLDGHKRAADSTPGGYISQLSQTHFFDPSEWDGQLRFKKRGGNPAFVLDLNDLAERDGAAIEERTIQEPELPRKITVGYIDPGAGFAVNTQAWERRAGTVEAKAETSFEAAICITADEAAGIAEKRGKVAWSEGDEFKFHLPYAWSHLTPTDVGTITDRRNATHRIRLMQVEEEGGVLMVQASKDRARNYVSTAIGVLPRPPVINTPGLIGSTILEVLNIPIWNDADDELGVYVAARGALPGWTGAELQLSSNGGATGDPVAQLTEAATIGYTLTGLAAAFAEAPSLQTVDVWLPDPPESVDYATLLRYYNRAVIGDEVIQYQTVASLGNGQYRLSGLLRGRYATEPVQQAAGVRFVLLDSAVKFLPMQRWMLGQPLQVRAVSYNTSPDAYAWIPLQIDTAQSQTEWAPFMVRANVVGADLVVTWVGRGRLGVDSNAYHSKYFAGYRITYDDGSGPVSYDITGTTHTLAGGASGGPRAITVAALNSITGAGPASEEITA